MPTIASPADAGNVRVFRSDLMLDGAVELTVTPTGAVVLRICQPGRPSLNVDVGDELPGVPELVAALQRAAELAQERRQRRGKVVGRGTRPRAA